MKRVKAQPISHLLRDYLRQEGLETPLLQHRLTTIAWPAVVGDYIANHTEKITIYNQTLYVQISSAAARQEIVLQRSDLVTKLNNYVDAYIISNIVVK